MLNDFLFPANPFNPIKSWFRLLRSEFLGPITSSLCNTHLFVIFIHDVFAMARAIDPAVDHFPFIFIAHGNVLTITFPVITSLLYPHAGTGTVL